MSVSELTFRESVFSTGANGEAATRPRVLDEREQLLRAAHQVLERSGWWGFKVESVLRRAGLSTRSFYRHFEKKNDLLIPLLERGLMRTAKALRHATDAADTPSNKVRAYVAAIFDMAYDEKLVKGTSLFAAHWRELLPEYPETLTQCTLAMRAPLTEAIADGVLCGELVTDSPEADSQAIFQLVLSMMSDQAASAHRLPRAELDNLAIPFITRAIRLR